MSMSTYSQAYDKLRNIVAVTQLLSELTESPTAGTELHLSADAATGLSLILERITKTGWLALEQFEEAWQEKGEKNA